MPRRPQKSSPSYGCGTVEVLDDAERIRMLSAMYSETTLTLELADGSLMDFVVTREIDAGLFEVEGIIRT